MASKKATLYFSSKSVKVAFFSGTPLEDFLSGTADALGVARDAPLRFRDADGDIVLVSSHMPDGLTLHVSIESGFAPAVEAARLGGLGVASSAGGPTSLGSKESRAPSWQYWAAIGGAATYCADQQVFTAPRHGTKSYWGLTGPLPTSGKHYIVLTALEDGRRPCCVSIGAVSASRVSLNDTHHGVDHPFSMKLVEVGRGPASAPDDRTSDVDGMRVGLLFDADARELTVVNHDLPRVGAVRFTGVPSPCRLFLSGPKHGLEAALRRASPPAELAAWKAPLAVGRYGGYGSRAAAAAAASGSDRAARGSTAAGSRPEPRA